MKLKGNIKAVTLSGKLHTGGFVINSGGGSSDHQTIKSGIGYVPKYTEPEAYEYTKEEE